MAQVVAARSINSSLACPSSRSLQNQLDKVKPSGFAAKVLSRQPRRGHRAFRVTAPITAKRSAAEPEVVPVTPEDVPKTVGPIQYLKGLENLGDTSVSVWAKPTVTRKTKIVCTIGPSTNTKEMIWKLAEAGMNVARMNMSHGDHASHQKVIDLVKEYNAQSKDNPIAIMIDTKGPEVRSGHLPQPINLEPGQEFTFTIQRGVGTADCVSVNYDDFVNDVEAGDMLLVDGGMMSFIVKSKTADSVKCEVVDGGELKSRRHLNVRGKSATLPSITEKDWDDIKFGVDNQVDFYAVSFVKDAAVVHELKKYLKSCNADIHVIVKIESADSIPNLHSIITASDGAMVARGDLGAELPIEEVPLLQEEIINRCRSMGKAVIVATNMLESMIVHPTPTRAEVSDIAIAVREGADAIMLSGETAHGKFPLKAVKVMHTVALRTEATVVGGKTPSNLGQAFKNHMSEMFAFHATMMSNTLGTSIVVFTRTGFMAILLSHYRPTGTIFAFTNDKMIQQRLALYQGVCPIYMEFSDDAEETFADSLVLLKTRIIAFTFPRSNPGDQKGRGLIDGLQDHHQRGGKELIYMICKRGRSSSLLGRAPKPLFQRTHAVFRRAQKKWKYSCFRQDETSPEFVESNDIEDKLPEVLANPESDQLSTSDKNWVSGLRKTAEGLLSAEPWTVPWTAKTILQKWKYSCFRQDETSPEFVESNDIEDKLPEVLANPESDQLSTSDKNWVSGLRKTAEGLLSAEPWTVPWTAKTILQVMLLWIASFWLVGSWIIPFLAHTAGFRKETLTYRGQALYSLLTDVAEGLAGIAILHRCLANFRPLPNDWFKFSIKGTWQFDVVLGCLMFPLVNRLSQVNLNLVPMLPSTPVTVSSVEQSIVARDPVAMALYAIVVSVCAPVWEEIVFRGFLLPSLTRYVPVWCSILVSSVAFALAHFNLQRMLPLVLLGVVMGAVFARSRNLLPSMLLHSLWNAFVFLDLMK